MADDGRNRDGHLCLPLLDEIRQKQFFPNQQLHRCFMSIIDCRKVRTS